MSRVFDVMVAGHVCLDIIPQFYDTGAHNIGELLRPGKLINVAEAKVSTGGPVSNTGLNMKSLGAEVCFCARVGDDIFGRITTQLLDESGNAEGIRVVEGAASSYTVALAPPGIDRIFLHNPGTNDTFVADDLDADLIAQCGLFHFGYPPLMARMFADEGAQLERVFRMAKEAGPTTSCDMSVPDPDSPSGKAPWRRILERILPYVDIFVPSIEEVLYMLSPDEFLSLKHEHGDADLIDVLEPARYSQCADELLRMGAKLVMLKTGHRGVYFKSGPAEGFAEMGAVKPGTAENWARREAWAPAFEVEHMASATGSGDSAIAGFLAAYLKGLPVEDALRYAVCLGWQNLQALDAVSGIRTWEETSSVLVSPPPQIEAQVVGAGWQWSESRGLWFGPDDEATA